MTYEQTRYRSLFLSDFHLGTHTCKAERLCQFLTNNDADCIYLVGDIIEGYHSGKWPQFHDDVLKILSAKALAGTEFVFIPGNHDSIFRRHVGTYGNIQIRERAFHRRPDGSTWLVVHGDETDLFPQGLWLWLMVFVERKLGIPLWELVRKCFKTLISIHTSHFESKMRKLSKGYDGIICGHIHSPKLSEHYINTGDWAKHCTAIAEHHDGTFELLTG